MIHVKLPRGPRGPRGPFGGQLLTVVSMLLLITLLFWAGAWMDTVSADDGTDHSLFVDAGIEADELLEETTVMRARFVNINFDLLGGENGPPLNGSGLGERLTLNLFDGTTLTAVMDRLQRNQSGSYTWIGHVQGIKFSQVILVIKDGLMIGKIAMPSAIYEVRYSGGEYHAIVQIDQSAFPSEEDDTIEVDLPEETPPTALSATDDGSLIDVLVLYTEDTKNGAGGTAGIEQTIELAVAESNQAYANSEVNQRLFLVHMEEVTYTESGSASTDLSRLRNTSDGFMDNVLTLRNTYHADNVVLITENGGGGCGVAYFMSSISVAFESSAYGVTARSCATGNYTFGHELGHNMGLRHDWYVNDGTTPSSEAHGYVNAGAGWRTIMAYNSLCSDLGGNCTRLPYWSNPNVNYNSAPMGVAGGTSTACVEDSTSPDPSSCDADNHSVLNTTAPTVAQWRASEVVWTGATSSDWDTASNWTMQEGAPGSTSAVQRVPRSIDNVRIPAGTPHSATIGADADVRDMLIEAGATLNITGGTLNVYGHWQEQGTGQSNMTGGTIVFKSNLEQTIETSSNSTFNDLQIGDSATQKVTLNSDLDVNGDLTLKPGVSFEADSHTINAAGNWNDAGNGFDAGTSTVILDGATQTLRKWGSKNYLLGPEGFEGTFPPTGWTTLDNTGNGDWNRNDAFSSSNWTNGSGFSAASKSQSTSTPSDLDNELRSPAISIPAEGAWLAYQSNFQDWNGNGDAWLDISTNGGTSWSNLSFWTQDYGPTYELINLTPYAGQTIMLRWRYVATAGNAFYWQIDDVEVYTFNWDGEITFHNLTVNSTNSAVFDGNLVVQNDLSVGAGGLMNLGTNDVTVEGSVSNNGSLQQSKNVSNAGTTYDFLTIKNAAGSATKYYGLNISPDGASGLGSTSVRIDGNQDCTVNAGDPALIKRCFTITPATVNPATIKYWFTEAERNENDANAIKAWRYDGTSWLEVGSSSSYGEPGSTCTSDASCWYQWTAISDFGQMGGSSGSAVTPSANVTASGSQFTPDSVTINVGETVAWNNSGGFHNVVADDGSFSSGPASSDPWTFNHTFNTAGTYQYYCQIHGAPGGVGMSGEVIVQDDSPTSSPINIEIGWNAISLPLEPEVAYTAQSVCNEINNQGGNVVEIDRWHAGGWQGHICGQSFNDFDLVLGSNYFIKSNRASTWTIEGDSIQQPVPLTLQIGWNSISIPHTDAYTAESLCDELIAEGVTAIEIDSWQNSGWQGHICGLPFNDFNIERGVGYFVKSSSAGTVTPTEP